MSLMSREDMLRELELLPVWQPRVPLPASSQLPPLLETEAISASLPALETLPISLEPSIEILNIETSVEQQLLAPETAEIIAPEVAQLTFTAILNDNADYLFVLPNLPLLADEQRLLQNIFMAMRIKAKPAQSASNMAELIVTLQPKLLIAMGESTAQALLQSNSTLADLRGNLHQFQAISLVATHDLAHLLQTSADKAEAWDDLCLAMHAMQKLS